MKRPHAARWSVLCLALAAMAGNVGWTQQKYRFHEGEAAGDVALVEGYRAFKMKAKVEGAGQPAREFNQAEVESDLYHERVLELGSHGVTAARRTYGRARRTEPGPDGRDVEKISSLQGKTITLRRADGKVEITTDKGELAPEDEEALKKEFGHSSGFSIFPDHDVSPGDEWTFDASKLFGPLFPGVQTPPFTVRFAGVEELDGQKCARLHLSVEMTGQPEGVPLSLTMKLSGDVYFAFDLQRTISMSLGGPIEGGAKQENGLEATISGSMTFKETAHWLKVGDKPVAAKSSKP